MTTIKRSYKKPELTVHGNVEEITLGGQSGSVTDADFPRGTPFGDLTFS